MEQDSRKTMQRQPCLAEQVAGVLGLGIIAGSLRDGSERVTGRGPCQAATPWW